jgi:hypothetical protein
MHRAILRNFASVCGEGFVVEPGPGGPPPGMSLWHFACAALNAGDVMSPALAWKRKPPPAFGSGKLGTPLARMHLAKATPARSGLAALSGDELAPPELADEGPFPEERCATVGLDEPPQPASASTTLRRAAPLSRRARGGVSLLVWMVCGIWSPSGSAAGVCVLARIGFYAVGCFVLVSLSEAGSGFVCRSRRNSVETLRRYLDHKEL